MIRATLSVLFWSFILLFVLLYPILISMHVFLPLFIGFSGYLIVRGIEGDGMRYIWLPLAYLVNLEINLSLPMFLALLSILLFRLTLYDKLMFLKRCPVCVAAVTVIMVDIYYLATLLLYDFLFGTSSVVVDSLLLFSLVFDLMFAVMI